MTLNGRRVSLGVFQTRDKAERVLAAALCQVDETDLDGMSLYTFGLRWLDRREMSGAYRSIDSMRGLWERYVSVAPFADQLIRTIRRADIKQWLQDLSPGGPARDHDEAGSSPPTVGSPPVPQTVKHVLNIVRACLRTAFEDEVIRENPAEGLQVPKRHEPQADKWTYLAKEEIASLLGCQEIPERFRCLYEVAIYTGLRKGELLGLRWGDVHLHDDRPKLIVRHSYDRAPKNGRKREVPLLDPARMALMRVQAAGGAIPMPNRLVWPGRDGGCHHRSYDAQWRRQHPKALGRRVRFHDLRHTCTSHLVMGTWGTAWRLEDVRVRLGHSTVMMTERYAHLAPESIHGLAVRTDEHFK